MRLIWPVKSCEMWNRWNRSKIILGCDEKKQQLWLERESKKAPHPHSLNLLKHNIFQLLWHNGHKASCSINQCYWLEGPILIILLSKIWIYFMFDLQGFINFLRIFITILDSSRCMKTPQGDSYQDFSFYRSYRFRRKHGLNYRITPSQKQWITYIMGTSVPLLNEYKREFLAKRLPQTILGGLKLRLGYDAPVYVYINQLILFLIPFLLGGLFTLLVELGTIQDYVAAYVYGGLMIIFVIVTQLISTCVQVRKTNMSHNLTKPTI